MSLKIAIHGALGQMGQTLVKLIAQNPDFQLVAALTKETEPKLGQDVGSLCHIDPIGIPIRSDIDSALLQAQVVIDFSTPQAVPRLLKQALYQKIPVVLGTTGIQPETLEAIMQASLQIPILYSANMSLGIAVLSQLVKETKKQLPHFDVEIVELHHRKKKDAPSGTALLLAQSTWQEQEEHIPKPKLLYGRSGISGPRTEEELGISAVRGGDVIGEHTVYFFGNGERIELTHRASNRDVFAHGALAAAKWLVNKPKGLYHLNDMLTVSISQSAC